MRWPLDAIYVTGEFKDRAVTGTGLKDSAGIARHIGVDLRAAVGTPVYAPADGMVTQSYTLPGVNGLQVVELRIGSYLWRFLHLSERKVYAGQPVKEGQLIAKSGNSGNVAAHLHIDVRKDGTAWNASLNNYIDPKTLITPKGGDMQEEAFNNGDIDNVAAVLGVSKDVLKGKNWNKVFYGVIQPKVQELQNSAKLASQASEADKADAQKWRRLKEANELKKELGI